MISFNGSNPLSFNGNYVLEPGAVAPPVDGAQLLWSDEFTGSAVSFATNTGGGSWRTRGIEGGPSATVPPSVNTGYIDYAGRSWNISPVQHPDNSPFSVSNSVLTITVRRNPGLTDVGGADWLGGLLVSNYLNGLSWQQGYFEWRMRLPNPVRGMFPALWLFANDPNRPSNYTGAEIDMFEVFGRASGTPSASGWHQNPSGTTDGGKGEYALTDSKIWHRYGVELTATAINYFCDGILYYSADAGIAPWFTHTPLGIRMDYVMDPNWMSAGAATVSTATDPAIGTEPRMDVDYVRVYSEKPANLATGSDDPGM